MTACGVALTHSAGKSPRQAGDWAPLLEGPGKMSVAQVAALCQPQPIGLMAKSICGLGKQQVLLMQLLRVCVIATGMSWYNERSFQAVSCVNASGAQLFRGGLA